MISTLANMRLGMRLFWSTAVVVLCAVSHTACQQDETPTVVRGTMRSEAMVDRCHSRSCMHKYGEHFGRVPFVALRLVALAAIPRWSTIFGGID